ncbi:MAG: MFS transporter [Paracoccaceae bacterium]
MTYLAPPHPTAWPPLAALSLAMLLPSLGTSITNVALPEFSRVFDATMPEVQWVVIAYLIAVTSCVLGAGRMGDAYGRRRFLLAGMALFVAATAASAFAPGLWVLVALRAVQGVGASAMMALTVAMVGDMVPKERTGSVIGLLGTVSAIGTAVGPTLGGFLLSQFGWPALFAALASVGVLAYAMGAAYVPQDAPRNGEPNPVQATSMLLFALALALVCISLTVGSALSAISLMTLATLVAASIAAFVAHERAATVPLLRFALLRDQSLSSGLIGMLLISSIVMTTLVVGPFHLSQTLGLSPLQTGLVMSVGPLVAALSGFPAGRLVDVLGTTKVTNLGLFLLVIGSGTMAALPLAAEVFGYASGLALITSGYALFQAANTTALMKAAPSDRKGMTSALIGLARNLGFVLGSSAMGTLFGLIRQIAADADGTPNGALALRVTFVVATALALVSTVVLRKGAKHDSPW